MNHKQHMLIEFAVFHKTFESVHKWLDELFPKYSKVGLSFMHWSERHHIEAVKTKYQVGTTEYNAALLHIVCDFLSHIGEFVIPKDKNEVLDILRENQLA